MNFIEELESRSAGEDSMFRARPPREDAARLRRLTELADEHDDRAEFHKAGRTAICEPANRWAG